MPALGLISCLAPIGAGAETLIQVSASHVPTQLEFDLRFEGGFNFGHSQIVDYVDDYTLRADDLTVPALHVEHRWPGGMSLGLAVGIDRLDLALDWNFRTTRRFEPEVTSTTSGTVDYAEVEIVPVLLDVGRVIALSRRVSLNLGASLGYLLADGEVVQTSADLPGFFSAPWRDPATLEPLPVGVDDEFVYGLFAQLELGLAGDRVRPFLRARALDADLEVEALGQRRQIELGPVWLELGVGFALPH